MGVLYRIQEQCMYIFIMNEIIYKMATCLSRSCIMNIVASTWVDVYHGIFANTQTILQEKEDIRMHMIKVGNTPTSNQCQNDR